MNWYSGFADRIEQHAPLGRNTWFRLGGAARYLFRPKGFEELAGLTVRARDADVPLRVLGTGANVLIRDDGFDGVVVRLDEQAFRQEEWDGGTVRVGAGVDLMPFSRQCCARGMSGLEGMAGIPSSVGGAVRMNAGGRFGEIADVVRRVRLLDRDGRFETWPHEQIGFGYRASGIGDRIVLDVELELEDENPRRVTERFDAFFEAKQRSQPMVDRSAGCIFKNPDGQSAGALIDRTGLKGTCVGRARVSQRHANFIVAEKGATSSDVLRLIEIIRERVRCAFATELELEIEVW